MTDTIWCPRVTVAVVVERAGRFLLVEEEAPEGRVFNQPAGHLDPGETLYEAARRETLEETGCEVALEGVVGMALYTSPANRVTYHRTTFYGSLVRELPDATLDPEIVAVHWLTAAEMRGESARMRSPLVIASVERYLQGARWPLDMIYFQQ